MKNSKKNDKFKMTELIMVNPFNYWVNTYIGTVKRVITNEGFQIFFGEVEIEKDLICCISDKKENIVKNLELIYSLKYKQSRNKKKGVIQKFSFFDLNCN